MTVIVISGMPGAGSSTTAKLLAKKLKLKHFSLGDASKKFGYGKETEKAVTYMLSKRGSSKSFHEHMDRIQKEAAKKGNVVIDSKLGIKMLSGLYDFSVWLKCSKRIRAERIAGRDKITLGESRRVVDEKERLERKRWHDMYGFDYLSQKRKADIIIDSGKRTPNEIVKLIIKNMKKK
ncbi:MAG: cytidylate kinase family protein [Candidatus Aenigmarchaeota archaeon]|nr:cytidylate kinase family protein [Candidatus Aenigmarchaeota archaeon]